MKILKTYASGFKTTLKSYKMISLVYIVILFLGLVVAIPFFFGLKLAAGMTISPGKLLHDFDYTTFSELLKFHGEEIKSSITQGSWIVVLFIVLSIFLTGGILRTLKQGHKKFGLYNFFAGCGKFFYRLVRLSLYSIILHALLALIIYVPFAIIVTTGLNHSFTEKTAFYVFLTFVSIHLLLGIYLVVITDYARFILVTSDTRKALKSLWQSAKFVSGKFIGTYFLFILLLVVPLLLYYMYFFLTGKIEFTTGVMILSLFLIQQVFVWLRVFFRVWTFSSQLDYFSMYHADPVEKKSA
ncbi:MAG: hypothetical protein QNK30_14940 [Bacteroidales bacterium]|nr:hypothetical protein [Bacteroidales bacterium]